MLAEYRDQWLSWSVESLLSGQCDQVSSSWSLASLSSGSGRGDLKILTTPDNVTVWQSKRDKNIKKQTQLCNPIGILDDCKLNCAKVQRSWMPLPAQLCKSTKVVYAANSTVQKYKGRGCCQLNSAKVQRSWMLPRNLACLS